MRNIREAIELCLEEEKEFPEMRFVGFRAVGSL